MINKALHIARGFTLIETLVAVLLLTTAIAGPLTIASKGLSSALIAKDQVGAFYLAQDAIEYIRFVRDSSTLADPLSDPLTKVVDLTQCEGTTGCYIDSIQSTVTMCGATCPVLNWDSSNSYYSYTTGTPSPQHYTRTIKITTPVGSNSDEFSINVTVSWIGQGGLVHSVDVRENLLNWQSIDTGSGSGSIGP